ncbi:hypothetical protein [Paractinoplanes durhamensis]|uniref:hypothetical protein n=1 Tax=Paractinoplanes durhamensis TaxID=113563 RepID=UPI00363BBBCD
MRTLLKISRLFTVVAACLVLTADVAVPASAAETGRARTAACEFVPVDDDSGDSIDAPAAVDRFKTPSAVPAKTTAFTSPDGFGGREYILGPSNGRCVAHGGMDQDFDQQITLPGQKTPRSSRSSAPAATISCASDAATCRPCASSPTRATAPPRRPPNTSSC